MSQSMKTFLVCHHNTRVEKHCTISCPHHEVLFYSIIYKYFPMLFSNKFFKTLTSQLFFKFSIILFGLNCVLLQDLKNSNFYNPSFLKENIFFQHTLIVTQCRKHFKYNFTNNNYVYKYLKHNRIPDWILELVYHL